MGNFICVKTLRELRYGFLVGPLVLHTARQNLSILWVLVDFRECALAMRVYMGTPRDDIGSDVKPRMVSSASCSEETRLPIKFKGAHA